MRLSTTGDPDPVRRLTSDLSGLDGVSVPLSWTQVDMDRKTLEGDTQMVEGDTLDEHGHLSAYSRRRSGVHVYRRHTDNTHSYYSSALTSDKVISCSLGRPRREK